MANPKSFTIIFIPPLTGLYTDYEQMGEKISEELDVVRCEYLLDYRLKNGNGDKQPKTLEELAQKYAEGIGKLRDPNIKDGNFIIIGHSFGGAVAEAVAKILANAEEPITPKHTFIIDTPQPTLTHLLSKGDVGKDIFETVSYIAASLRKKTGKLTSGQFNKKVKEQNQKIKNYLEQWTECLCEDEGDWSDSTIDDLLSQLDKFYKEIICESGDEAYKASAEALYERAARPNIKLLLLAKDFFKEQTPNPHLTVVTTSDSVAFYKKRLKDRSAEELEGLNIDSLGWSTQSVVSISECDHYSILENSSIASYLAEFVSIEMLGDLMGLAKILSSRPSGELPAALADMLKDVQAEVLQVASKILAMSARKKPFVDGADSSLQGVRFSRPEHI